MCLSVPAEVISVQGDQALVSVEGVKMQVSSVMLNDLKPGDFVLIHSGFAIQIIDSKEAEASLEIIRHMRVARDGDLSHTGG